jgi:exopolysaccharide production protein ExoQ
MSKVAMHSGELGRARSPAAIFDKFAIIPVLACAYVAILIPLLSYISPRSNEALVFVESQWENRVFWPLMAACAIALAVVHRSRLRGQTVPFHIICLLAFFALAGASVLWAFKPELSFTRFAQQALIVTSILLPVLLADKTTDVMRALFLCFAFGLVLNILLGFGGPVNKSFEGYFLNKNALGQFAALACFLALNEMLYRGSRRVLGIIVFVVSLAVLYFSQSKTSLGIALIAPALAGITIGIRKATRISLAVIISLIPIVYVVLSTASVIDMYRLSYLLFGDATFSARTSIWDFVLYEISRRPYLGWGYQSFWLVGPDGPSIVDGRGWVSTMPQAHNGYLDAILQMGYAGLGLLVVCIFATIHAIGRVADRDGGRAWFLLTIVLFVALHNFLESTWMRGSEMLWLMFLVVAADVGRYWKKSSFVAAPYKSASPRPANVGPGRRRALPTGRY